MDQSLTYEVLIGRAFDKYYYLASPYSHPDPKVVEQRVELAYHHHALLLSRGVFTFCPVWSCHRAAHIYDMPKDAEFWKKYNTAFIRPSAGVIVCDIEGWVESKGVQWEFGVANRFNLPVYLMTISGDAHFEQLAGPNQSPEHLSSMDSSVG
jgi:hypothetical protein